MPTLKDVSVFSELGESSRFSLIARDFGSSCLVGICLRQCDRPMPASFTFLMLSKQ